MVLKTVLIVVAILLAIYLIVWMFSSKAFKISGMQSGEKETIVAAADMPGNGSNNFTYSTWFFVKDWNYRYGESKSIIKTTNAQGDQLIGIDLAPNENNVNIQISCYGSNSRSNSFEMHNCVLRNVPIQRWVNLLVSVNGRTMDVYMNGKLTRTCVLPGVARISATPTVHITPNGGFSGYTSQTDYYGNSTNPQEAYDIYRNGFGGGMIGSLLNKYKIKVSFLEDDIETGAFEI